MFLTHRLLVCIDDPAGGHAALRLACAEAQTHGRRLALLIVTEPAAGLPWGALTEILGHENHREATKLAESLIEDVCVPAGITPEAVIFKTGDTAACLLQALQEDPDVTAVALGAPSDGGAADRRHVQTVSALIKGKISVPMLLAPGAAPEQA